MNLSQLIKKLFEATTTKIVEFVNVEIENDKKKEKLDSSIQDWVKNNMFKLDKVQQFIVAQYVIPTLPMITQLIYDCLKQKIEGVTI